MGQEAGLVREQVMEKEMEMEMEMELEMVLDLEQVSSQTKMMKMEELVLVQ